MSVDREWNPRKSRHVVTLRRWKRRIHAVASIGLALAAGTFLAAHARADSSAPRPKKPDASREQPKPKDEDKPTAGGKEAAAKDKGKEAGKRPAKDADKGKPKERDQDKPGDEPKRPDRGKKVDRDEHRKGMPVPDNLLE